MSQIIPKTFLELYPYSVKRSISIFVENDETRIISSIPQRSSKRK